jgi:hypothetical protein
MTDGRDDIQWSPRVPKEKLRRLYEDAAQGMYDSELVEEVGMMLYMRCRDILWINDALERRQVHCPRCDREGNDTAIKRTRRARAEVIECEVCGWSITWEAYHKSFKRRQLNPGGAAKAFSAYLQAYMTAKTAREKVLAIDRVIHAFHFSLRVDPERPTRAAGVNLISGRLTDVVKFLDELAGYATADQELRETLNQWRDNYARTYWPDIMRCKT